MTNTTTIQLSLATALEELAFELLQVSRQTTEIRHRGPTTKAGEPRTRGMRMVVCAHPNCGGVRKCWPFKALMICARDWRVRRRIFALLENGKRRAAEARSARGPAM